MNKLSFDVIQKLGEQSSHTHACLALLSARYNQDLGGLKKSERRMVDLFTTVTVDSVHAFDVSALWIKFKVNGQYHRPDNQPAVLIYGCGWQSLLWYERGKQIKRQYVL